MSRFRFTILAIILMLGLFVGTWVVDNFFPETGETGVRSNDWTVVVRVRGMGA